MEVLPPSRGNGANQKSRAFHTNECPSATRGSGRPDGPPPVLFTRIRGSVSNISAVRARRDNVGPLKQNARVHPGRNSAWFGFTSGTVGMGRLSAREVGVN
jgi:hypothetical protein